MREIDGYKIWDTNMYLENISANTLLYMYQNNEVKFDSEMQRGEVWNRQKSSLYINSVFLKLTMYQSPFLVNKTVDENGAVIYDVLDGKQRGLASLIRFINDEYSLSDLRDEPTFLYEGKPYDLSKRKFSQLPINLQNRLKDVSIPIAVMDNASREEKAIVFRRFNNGKSMSQYDIARSFASDLTDINELSQHELFNVMLSTIKHKALEQQILVSKAYIIMFTDNITVREKQIRDILSNLDVTAEQKEKMNHAFDFILEAYKFLNSEDETVARKIFDRTQFFTYVKFVEKFESARQLADWMKEFYNNTPEEYTDIISKGHTTSLNMAKPRYDIMENSINEFLSR